MKIHKSLWKGSITLLIAFNLFNFFNFVFHFSMARLLTVAEFGILSALFAIIYILSGFSESIQVVISKYSTKEKNKGKIKNVLRRALRKSFLVAILLFIIYLVIAVIISYLTKINYFLIALTGLIIFVAFLVPITRGILQGKKRFKALGVNMISEALIKLILAIALVLIGWKVYGAIIGTLVGGFAAFALSFIKIKDIIKTKEQKTTTKDIYNYATPSFFIVLTILFFYSIDVLIARIFFTADIAGAYAIASILAKTIFFGTYPISKAMFPLTVESKLKKSENIFINALVIMLFGIIVALIIFYFFPGLIILIFSGKVIPLAAQILFYLAIATSLISLTNLILLYKLSLGKVRGYPYLIVFILIEIFLLSYFSANVLQFSIAFIVSSAAFLWGSIVLLKD